MLHTHCLINPSNPIYYCPNTRKSAVRFEALSNLGQRRPNISECFSAEDIASRNSCHESSRHWVPIMELLNPQTARRDLSV